jgi:hypothetical protein
MREVSTATTAVWLSGNFVGNRRAMARVTLQHPNMDLYDLGYNVYASLLFGHLASQPVELPNVKSVKWARGVDTDVATGTLELYNTAPQELGTTYNASWGIDQPGYYTYEFSDGETFNPLYSKTERKFWQSVLVPDQILRTYEGYGFDPTVCPENDENLYQTGVWIIKDVQYDVTGLITVNFEDLGSILRDQVAFYPVVPKNFYPLQFSAVPKTSGFAQGYTVTKTVDSGGNFDPKNPPPGGWTGPLTAPLNVRVVDGPSGAVITWDEVPQLDSQHAIDVATAKVTAAKAHLASIHRGTSAGNASYAVALLAVAAAEAELTAAKANAYKITGYQVVIDNVPMGQWVIPYGTTRRAIIGAPFVNGNVYQINIVAIFERLHDGHQQAGNDSVPVFAHPYEGGAGGEVDNIVTDDAPPPADPHQAQVQVPGVIGFSYTGTVDTFQIVVFKKTGEQNVYAVAPDGGSATRQYFQTGQGALAGWDVLIYPVTDGKNGKGAFYSVDGAFFQPPVAGAPPHEPSPLPKGTPTVTKKATPTSTKTTTVLNPVELHPTFSDTSNTYYVGAGENVSVYGHTPKMALDDDDASYWLSIGNIDPGRDFAFEWFEVKIPNQEVSSVKFHNKMGGYFCYLSVFAKGTWVHHDAGDIIPYNAKDPISHNGGNIPYAETLNCGTSEGPFEITLRASIPGVTKVRLTFHNLQDFGVGAVHYRAGLRKIKVYGITSSSSTTKTGGGGSSSTSPPSQQDPKPGPIHDDDDPSIVSTYTVYIPPKETPGAGSEPGKYEDYTDIIKLLCAWAGFYWPPNATIRDACGNTTTYDWGPGLYGLKNVDPVLGGQDSGRVWGDFMDTGTAGVVDLPVSNFAGTTSLLDCISKIRDIIGFLFYIDEQGAVIWRLPNIFAVGNYVGNYAADAGRSQAILSLDERTTLIDLKSTLSSRNVRERYFVASTDGKTGALAAGFNPNPIGLRRVGGWTDQNFASDNEAVVMADMIALAALMTYRVDTVQIAGYPGIQVDDQVRITEKVSGENFLHYVRGISSTNDLESGVWTYDLNTNWLGVDPFSTWLFNPAELSTELQQYLDAVINAGGSSFAPPPSDGDGGDPTTGGTTTQEEKVAKLVQVTGKPAVYITDGVYKRHVIDQDELTALVKVGVISSKAVTSISQALMNRLVDVNDLQSEVVTTQQQTESSK